MRQLDNKAICHACRTNRENDHDGSPLILSDQPYSMQDTHESSSQTNASLVPDVLLAVAKDARYLDQCKSLLVQVLGTSNDHDDERRASLAATVFYVMLVLLRQGKSIGEETLGIEYETKRWRLVVGSLVVAFGRHWAETLTTISNSSTGTENRNNEALRGSQRHAIFEQQRQRMIQQATVRDEQQISQNQTEDQRRSVSSAAGPLGIRWNIKALLKQLLTSLGTSSSSLFNGLAESPHLLESSSQVQPRASLGAWLVRLHLAWYCLDEEYPSVLHRIFRLKQRRMESRLVHRPNTARIVGMLILMQAFGSLVPKVGKRFARWWVERVSPPDGSSSAPAIEFYSDAPSSQSNLSSSSTATTSCVICRQERIHTACSVKCGHLMCWSCLQQWVHEWKSCPICRLPCQAQDVMAIQCYKTTSH